MSSGHLLEWQLTNQVHVRRPFRDIALLANTSGTLPTHHTVVQCRANRCAHIRYTMRFDVFLFFFEARIGATAIQLRLRIVYSETLFSSELCLRTRVVLHLLTPTCWFVSALTLWRQRLPRRSKQRLRPKRRLKLAPSASLTSRSAVSCMSSTRFPQLSSMLPYTTSTKGCPCIASASTPSMRSIVASRS